MTNTFLCLITNRWTPREFISWLEGAGYYIEHVKDNLYAVEDEFNIDVYRLDSLSDMDFGAVRVYQGVMLEGASLDPEEVEGLLSLNQVIALKERPKEKPSHLKVVKEEEDI